MKYICPKCEGEGAIMNRSLQVFFGVFSFGLTPFIDSCLRSNKKESQFSDPCPLCRGDGFIRQD